MAKLQQVKRFQAGMKVQCDPIGNGSMISGVLSHADSKFAYIDPDDGSDQIRVVRAGVYKGTGKATGGSSSVEKARGKANARSKKKTIKKTQRKRSERDDEDGVHINPDFDRYVESPNGEKTVSGRNTLDIDDVVGQEFRGLALDEVYKRTGQILRALGVTEIGKGKNISGVTQSELHGRYDHLNPGMQRMCLGNIVRGAMVAAEVDEIPA